MDIYFPLRTPGGSNVVVDRHYTHSMNFWNPGNCPPNIKVGIYNNPRGYFYKVPVPAFPLIYKICIIFELEFFNFAFNFSEVIIVYN